MTDHSDAVDTSALAEEQAVLDYAERCLAAMAEATANARASTDRAVREENTADARVAQWHLRRREEALKTGSGPLCFGRIDEESPRPTVPGERWYVGRRHVEDAVGDPVVVDWRAPVSAPFYRATGIDPCGLVHRRRFSTDGSELVAIFDEDLTDPDSGSSGGLPDPLLAELDRARTGQMRDIVATIAAEQDRIIRADLETLLIVQGGPGTGKTAVGLHRAAFLLFAHRDALTESGVLVVGPNPLFLRYIAEVLPSLGESSVVQTTAERLLAGRFPIRSHDSEAAAIVKGDLRMANVIANALRSRVKVLEGGIEMRSGVYVVRLDEDEVERLQQTALVRSLPMNDAREVFRKLLLQEAWRRHGSRLGVDTGTQPAFLRAIETNADFKKDVDKMWPTLSAAAVVRDLLGSARRLAAASNEILTDDERIAIKRKASKSLAAESWTAGDMGLLDEAGYLTAGVPATYGHVVVDEAQDHSAMTLRMLGRRAGAGSMTILGDLAQATAPVALGSWAAAADALTGSNVGQVQVTELTVGYRVPASVLDFANRLLAEAAPEVTPAKSVRPGGSPPLILSVAVADKGTAVLTEVTELRERTSSVAVVGEEEDLDAVEAALSAAGVPVERVGRAGLPGADAVALVDADGVKGLEFDAVVVVEPAAIAAGRNGLRRLYVALTRSVQHLGIVHAAPLPPALVADDDPQPRPGDG